ncbi:loganic acid O-methyltransferase-like [Rhodamnia argentea]|uniref:Loganic acid O-methyltransferase-like n=1 Tax=Rhodamnia argentea TaxID=178133 RepID=A0A8B8QWD0_9MYRT|nr:loganic acid O-methyltransferase-like [Rhodamnia argentea]
MGDRNPGVDSPTTNGGDGRYSYSKNSQYQRLATNIMSEKIDAVITEKFDVASLSSTSHAIRLADLGCATGPNTILAMQNIVQILQRKFNSQCPNSRTLPEFHVFFNDKISNDFNTLFATLPSHKPYFAAGVPGSFHTRLFPNASLHFVYSSIALHWLSEVPEKVTDRDSAAWNKGRAHYTSAPEEVVKAYAEQFAKDMEEFLRTRADEVVSGGMMVIIMPGIPHGMPHRRVPSGIMYDVMASSLMDMVNEGLVSEDKVASFNLPLYAPSPEEMTTLVTKNGNFTIEAMELTNPSPNMIGPIDVRGWMVHVRAAMEGMLAKHFDKNTIAELFNRLVRKLSGECSQELEASYREGIQLFTVLKRR